MPEEMEEADAQYGFVKIRNIGTDFFITMSAVNQMNDKKFEAYRKFKFKYTFEGVSPCQENKD